MQSYMRSPWFRYAHNKWQNHELMKENEEKEFPTEGEACVNCRFGVYLKSLGRRCDKQWICFG
jgi:hypothetical protein